VFAQNTTPVGPLADNGGVLRVGNGDTTFPGFESWHGGLDEVRVWPIARTASEITATTSEELSALPSNVLTFNLNNVVTETSRGLPALAVGALVFVPNPLGLTPRTGMASTVGQTWSTCRGPVTGYGSLPRVGNAAFSLFGAHGAASGAGALLLGPSATPSAFTILGIGIHLPTIWVAPGTPTDALGTARGSLPVPNMPGLAGNALCAQWVFAQPGCGPFGLTASAALCFTIQ
jgi:hypothetical protein